MIEVWKWNQVLMKVIHPASSVNSPSEMETRVGRTGLGGCCCCCLTSVDEDGARSRTGAGRVGDGGSAYIDCKKHQLIYISCTVLVARGA